MRRNEARRLSDIRRNSDAQTSGESHFAAADDGMVLAAIY